MRRARRESHKYAKDGFPILEGNHVSTGDTRKARVAA
jgi:hypothetical protein